jgi:hypothetical protein
VLYKPQTIFNQPDGKTIWGDVIASDAAQARFVRYEITDEFDIIIG